MIPIRTTASDWKPNDDDMMETENVDIANSPNGPVRDKKMGGRKFQLNRTNSTTTFGDKSN